MLFLRIPCNNVSNKRITVCIYILYLYGFWSIGVLIDLFCLGLKMCAELQVVSPLVPTREAQFLRYCQQNAEEGSWAIVDFPIDSFHDNNIQNNSFPRYRRRPSGCVIQDMPNGYSRVST